jgi:stage IV sporulation protein FB
MSRDARCDNIRHSKRAGTDAGKAYLDSSFPESERPMRWSVGIGSIAGTTIRIHITFLMFLAWIFAASWATDGSAAAISMLAFVLAVFACVVAHEFGHIFTARAFGIATPDVTLLPIGGVARLESIPEAPRAEFLIAIAGPLVNVAIALLLVALAGADINTERLVSVEQAAVPFASRLASVNMFIAVFNLIPAFPMDGGRVLRALLGIRLGHVRATEIAATVGQWVAFILGFIGLFSNPLLIFIAIFVYLAAASEAQLVTLRSMSREVPVRAAMMTQFATLTPDEHIDAAVETLLRTSQNEFPVVDGAGKLTGLLGRTELIAALKQLGPGGRVADAMTADIPTVNHRGCLDEAFKVLQEKSSPAVGIIDGEGRLVGLVTPETIGEMLMVREAMPAGTRLGPWSRPARA